jgi:hypothetical protein
MFVKLLSGDLISVDVEKPMSVLQQVAEALSIEPFRVELIWTDDMYTALVQDHIIEWVRLDSTVLDQRGVPHHSYHLTVNGRVFHVFHRGGDEYGFETAIVAIVEGDESRKETVWIRHISNPMTKEEVEQHAMQKCAEMCV